MPDILIEIGGDWLGGRRRELLDAVHGAVADALRTPRDEPVARLVVHPADSFLTPRSAGARFTRIEIALFAGRSLETKRRLYRTIVAALRPLDVPPADVKIALVEFARADVSLSNGDAACDVEIGYSLQI